MSTMKFDTLIVEPCRVKTAAEEASCPDLPKTDDRCADEAFRRAYPDLCRDYPKLIIKPGILSLCQLASKQFKAFLYANNTEVEITSGLTWASSDPSIVVMGVSSGKATGLAEGIATISATFQNHTGYAQITVLPADCCDGTKVGMAVVVDNSLSMTMMFSAQYATKLAYAKAMAYRFVSELNDQKDVAAVMSFNESGMTVVGLTDEVQDLKNAVTSIPSTSKKTNIADALTDAIGLLEADTTLTRRVVLLISDLENREGEDPVPIADTFEEAGGVVFVVGVRAFGAGFDLGNQMASGGFFLNAHNTTAKTTFDLLSGLKGYVCAGNCTPPGDRYINVAKLQYFGFKNWDVTSGGVDLIGGTPPYDKFDLLPGNGLYVDMAGSAPWPLPPEPNGKWLGKIESKTTFNFVGGTAYRLVFQLAGNNREPTPPEMHYRLRVRVGDSLVDATITVDDYKQDFTDYTYDFTPGSNVSGKISFELIQQADVPAFGLLLDDVSLVRDPSGTPTILFTDTFDTENSIYIEPQCGSPQIAYSGYGYGYDCYGYGCLTTPPPAQVEDPAPQPDLLEEGTTVTSGGGGTTPSESSGSFNPAGMFATLAYVDQRDAEILASLQTRFVEIAGDTMTGFLTLHANPTSAMHAATKQYVDQLIPGSAADFVNTTGDTMTGNLIQEAAYAFAPVGAGADVFMVRDSANTMALRNGANPQVLNLYRTYTSAAVYERLYLGWSGFTAYLTTQNAGGGTSPREIEINSIANFWTSAVTIHGELQFDNTLYAGLKVNNLTTTQRNALGITADGMVIYNTTDSKLQGFVGGAWTDIATGALNPFVDSSALVKGSADATKLLRFEVDGFTTGTTRVLTPQNADYIIAGTNLTQTFTAPQTIDLGSIASLLEPLTLTATWNNAALQFAGQIIRITDTASSATSLLIAGKINSIDKWTIDKTGKETLAGGLTVTGGKILAPTGSLGAPGLSFTADTTTGIRTTPGLMWFDVSSAAQGAFDAASFYVFKSLRIGPSQNTILNEDEANTLALRNGTAAQTFRIYNTYTDANNYERLNISWASNFCYIQTANAGTGVARSLTVKAADTLYFGGGNGSQWFVGSSGHFLAFADNTNDIGANGALRPRNIYAAGAITAVGGITSSGGISATNLVLAQGTLTDPALMIDGSVTWNDAADTFTAWKLNVTNTASGVSSLLLDLQVGGASKFYITPSGGMGATGQAFAISFRAGEFYDHINNAFYVNTIGVQTKSTGVIAWSSDATAYGTPDLYLLRDSANTLALRNGTNAQAFRIYNTYTDTSNYERAMFGWSGNVMYLYTDQAGTGTARDLVLGTIGASKISFSTSSFLRWHLNASGHLLTENDNLYDIGTAGARPRNIYAGTSFLGPNGSAAAPTYSFSGATNDGFYTPGAGDVRLSLFGFGYHAWFPNAYYFLSNTATILLGASSDTILTRDAANTLALRNGTNAQVFNVYQTHTDISNYIRLTIGSDGSQFYIYTQGGGTGAASTALNIGTATAQPLNLSTTNVNRWQVNSSGHLLAVTDNTYNIGALGTNRPANIYASNTIHAYVLLQTSLNLYFTNFGYIQMSTDGIIVLYNNAANNFGRLQFGGTTSSFPALKRSSAELQVRLADDSADAALKALSITLTSGAASGKVLTSDASGVATWQDAPVGGAPFADTTSIVKGSADATKLLRFEVDGFTTGTTRVITPPNADINLPGTNIANTWTVGQLIAQGTITSAIPALDSTVTWNNSAINFTGWKLNVTDTLSEDASLLIDLQIGGSSKFKVDKNSNGTIAGDFTVGDDLIVTDGATITGALTANSLASTTSITGSSLTVTGAVAAQSLQATSFLSIAQGTIVNPVNIIDATATWNDAADTFTGFKLNITDTASAVASWLMDLQVGGTSKFKVTKAGELTLGSHLNLPSASLVRWGSTANDPALKKNSSTLEVRSGNDAAYLGFTADTFFVGGLADANEAAGVIAIKNASVTPAGSPVGGGVLFAEAGAGKWRGSSGTTTTFGVADPHCPRCGKDFALEWENPKYGGKFSVCIPCMVKAMDKRGIKLDEFMIEQN